MGPMPKPQTIKVAFKLWILILTHLEVFLDKTEGTLELHKKRQSKKIIVKAPHKFIKLKIFQMQFNYKKHSKKL